MFRDHEPDQSAGRLIIPGDLEFEIAAATLLLGEEAGLSVLLGPLPVTDRQNSLPIFSEKDREEIFQAVEAATEYADDEEISAVVFIDKSARPMWVGFKEHWQATHGEDEPVPDIFFVEPQGFDEMRWAETSEAKEKMEAEHPFLYKHKDGKVLVVDTCIHDGQVAGAVLDGLDDVGFKDVKFAVVDDARNTSFIKPDKVLLDRRPEAGCYPFSRVGWVTDPEHTRDHLYSESWNERNPFRIRKLRDEIRGIVRDHITREES